jgi:hypothetical protein
MMIEYLKDKYFRLNRSFMRLVLKSKLKYTRREIHQARRLVARNAGGSAMTPEIKRAIKQYARERFGSAAYWPGLALAVEMRREFVKGCIPFDYFYYTLEPKLNPPRYSSIGDLRTLDYRRFGDFAIKPLCQLISGIWFNADFEPVGGPELKKILSDHNDTIVIKEEFGWGGKEVRVLHADEFIPGELAQDTNYIIQPYIKQYKPLHDLHPESVNTFRVLTFKKRDGSIEVLVTFLRFGVDGSRVDNLSSGGQCVRFDASGKPEPIGYDEFGLECGRRHKNSGIAFADLEIPMIHEIREKCISIHREYPHNRLIGWDIAVDESGALKLIEWNSSRPSFCWEDALFGPFFPDDQELK